MRIMDVDDHTAECVEAIEAIGGDPATVGDLVRIAKRIRGWECTCVDGGTGFQCEVCEANALLAKLPEDTK